MSDMWKYRYEYDGVKYYDYRGKRKYTLVRIPGKTRDKYNVWDASGRTISVQYFDDLTKAKRYVEKLDKEGY